MDRGVSSLALRTMNRPRLRNFSGARSRAGAFAFRLAFGESRWTLERVPGASRTGYANSR
jgi:hypothetical protein